MFVLHMWLITSSIATCLLSTWLFTLSLSLNMIASKTTCFFFNLVCLLFKACCVGTHKNVRTHLLYLVPLNMFMWPWKYKNNLFCFYKKGSFYIFKAIFYDFSTYISHLQRIGLWHHVTIDTLFWTFPFGMLKYVLLFSFIGIGRRSVALLNSYIFLYPVD